MDDYELKQDTINSFDNKMSSSGKYKQINTEKEEKESNDEEDRQF